MVKHPLKIGEYVHNKNYNIYKLRDQMIRLLLTNIEQLQISQHIKINLLKNNHSKIHDDKATVSCRKC